MSFTIQQREFACLRLFYSRTRIMSDEARHGWVEPDLAPLPGAPGN